MIERHQISEALARLTPRDREILDYSLRRRVPDVDLAAIFDSDPSEVAKQRAAAIEKLSQDLDARRGADLGHILKELLDGGTWEALGGAHADDNPPQAQDGRPVAHKPLGAAVDADPVPAPEGEAGSGQAPASEAAERQPESEQSTTGPEPATRARSRVLVGVAAAIAVLAPAGVVYALTAGDGNSSASGDQASGTRAFSPLKQGAAEPFPSDPQSAYQYPTATVTRRTALYRKPDGKVRLRVSAKTEWGSPRILGVTERRGHWLAVLVPELKNGQEAWVRDDRVSGVGTVSWSLNADLSKRRMTVEHDGKVVRTMKIGVGRSDHPTPVGRYAVTDKLRVSDPGSPYGCCVLALTGHQTRLPAGWPGGDRLAVHATQDLSGLGKRVSLGCMRTNPKDTKWMLGRIPLGAPVFVRG